jgi:N-acetylated-alpha-linked acidic dipeptidase
MKEMSAGERQPLLAHVAVAPAYPRYPRRRLFSRIVTFVLGAGLIGIVFGLFFFPSWPPDAVRAIAEWYEERIPLETLEEIMLFTPSEDKAREWSQYYTAGPHLAGKNLSQAIWTKEKWEEYGIASEIVTYDIYTNYPVSHRLALLNASKSEEHAELLYEAGLEEKVLEEDPTTALEDRIPTFHGYSANGSVTAEFIWANYGTLHDFNDLVTHGVDIAGKVVIVRYGHIFRGLKVKRAQELGAVGVVMYSDPGDDGMLFVSLSGASPNAYTQVI